MPDGLTINNQSSVSSTGVDYWFSFVANGSDLYVTLSTDNTTPNFDQLSVSTGSCNSLTTIANGDDLDGDHTIFLSLNGLTIGQTYYIYTSRNTIIGCRTCIPPLVTFSILVAVPPGPCDDMICNGSFENISSPPTCNGTPIFADYSIRKCSCWHNGFEDVNTHGIAPYEFSADYYHVPTGPLTSCLIAAPSPHSNLVNAGMAYGADSPVNYQEYIVSTATAPVTAGRYYRVSFYYKRVSGSDPVTVRAIIATSQYAADHAIGNIPSATFESPSTNGYTRVDEYYLASSSGPLYLCLTFETMGLTDNNYVFVDDVSMYESVALTSVSDLDVCESQNTVNLTAAGATSYSWSVSPSATLIPSGATCDFVIPSTSGNYTVTVAGITPAGCSTSVSIVIHVNATPLANVTIIGPNPSCVGNPPTLQFSPTFLPIQWYDANGPIGFTTYNFTPTQSGSYYAIVTNPTSGCTNTSSVTVVTLVPNPTVSLTPTSEHCLNANDGQVTTSVTGTGPFTYAWSPLGQTTANITGLDAGTYGVVVTDTYGCTATASATVGTSSLPSPPVITHNALNNNLCGGTTVTYQVSTYNSSYNYVPTYSEPPLSVTSPLAGVWVV